MVKIAISGKMCSGKSTLTKKIIEYFEKKKISNLRNILLPAVFIKLQENYSE